jgi:glycosyltransferase involved in cell wall biosynthesis
MKSFPTFSIVINTLNRGDMLRKTLESLDWLDYPGEFEVVVVNGPSTDNSPDVIRSWSSRIRAGRCDVANLSVSRNIGICMAQGDVIAFIDDDAIPEPEWLTQLAEAYANPEVGGVGGLVYDHTGYAFQYRYCLVDRFGNADPTPPVAMPHLSFPKSNRIPHLLGANSSFRRSALLEIGGFDEEYEYFLDETDVCLRIVDAGYLIAQLPAAYVHHKFAPSNLRGENRVPKYRYPIIKNKIYFTLKHSREFYPTHRVLEEQNAFIQKQKDEVAWCVSENLLAPADVERFNADVERAIEVGLRRGFEGPRPDAYIDEAKIERFSGEFHRFEPIANRARRSIVLVSSDFPPGHGGGIATFNKDLAEGLAADGHTVHVVTRSPDINRVDFEQGVWVHRLVPGHVERTPDAVARRVPQHVWNWSATALREVARIAEHRKVDVVEAPVWDCEGIAFLLDNRWPLVTSLQTTLHFWLESHPEQRQKEGWMEEFARPMLALELELMSRSDAVRSISAAIRRDIESAYRFKFEEDRIFVQPLGMSDAGEVSSEPSVVGREVLFVGRLEPRKGIDVLLDAIPEVLKRYPDASFRIVGDDTLFGSAGKTYKQSFLESEAGRRHSPNVHFEGRLDDDALRAAYARCDLFVAPSRFESFGLVFLEAMRAGKPVIGCDAGGMPEIIEQGINGLVVPVDDSRALAQAIIQLLGSDEQRASMGAAGRAMFLDRFTSERMAKGSEAIYDRASQVHSQDGS